MLIIYPNFRNRDHMKIMLRVDLEKIQAQKAILKSSLCIVVETLFAQMLNVTEDSICLLLTIARV